MAKNTIITTPFANPAAHGLGSLIVAGSTIEEALIATGLNWEVEMIKGVQAVTEDGRMFESTRENACGRCDNEKILGVHKNRYRPVQNSQLFEIGYAMNGQVEVESAGSFDEGRRVFITMRGTTFEIQNGEKCVSYLILTNSHDGSTKLQAIPATLRLKSNTTVPLRFMRNKGQRVYTIRHDGSIDNKIKDLTVALQNFKEDADTWYEDVVKLQKRSLTKEDMATFWGEIYEKVLKKAHPVTPEEKKEAEEVFTIWQGNLEKDMQEQGISTPDAWLAANAVASDLQTSTPLRCVGDWQTRRIEKNWFGDTADKTASVFQQAMEILG